jgi:hypothetical protein
MRPIFLPLKMFLALTVLGGVTLLACGDDPAPAARDEDEDEDEDEDKDPPKDAKKDGGKDTKKDGGGKAPAAEKCDEPLGELIDCECPPGVEEEGCVQTCFNGTLSPCVSESTADAVKNLLDGGTRPGITVPGLPDGSTVSVRDGTVSVKVGDADINIPGVECPSSLVCSSKAPNSLAKPIIDGLSGGAPLCVANDGIGAPPTCSTVADCTAMGLKGASCATYCIQVCK